MFWILNVLFRQISNQTIMFQRSSEILQLRVESLTKQNQELREEMSKHAKMMVELLQKLVRCCRWFPNIYCSDCTKLHRFRRILI